MSSLQSTPWYAHFRDSLFSFSYDELVQSLLRITEGRLNPRAPFEVEITPDLSVRVFASPRLRMAPGADRQTQEDIELLDLHMRTRDRTLSQLAAVVAIDQRAFFAGYEPKPRRLDLAELAARAEVPHDTAYLCIRSKRVLHPCGMSSLCALIDPDLNQPATPIHAVSPHGPHNPLAMHVELLPD